MRQASCSSTSAAQVHRLDAAKEQQAGRMPAAANSPARTLSFRIQLSTGAVTRLRTISVSLILIPALNFVFPVMDFCLGPTMATNEPPNSGRLSLHYRLM
jgi:hypothetical protein